jgi:hypothetical protein
LIAHIGTRISDPKFTHLISQYLKIYEKAPPYLVFSLFENLTLEAPLLPVLFELYIRPYDLYINSLSLNKPFSHTRYINSIIIGATLPYTTIMETNLEINSFISSSLKISLRHNKIYFYSNNEMKFFNIHITILPSPLKRKIKFSLNTKLIIKNLRLLGFCSHRGDPLPQFKLYSQTPSSIAFTYNQTILLILSNFQFFDNFISLSHTIQHIFKKSYIKLLSAKLKLNSTRAVYKKHGKPFINN